MHIKATEHSAARGCLSHKAMARLITAVIALLAASSLAAQTAPEFEVATLKRSGPAPGDLININLGTIKNNKLTLTNASLSDCIKFAWGIVADAQLAGPDWLRDKSIRYDVVAEALPGAPREQLLLMLQSLLAERLKVTLHHERRSLSYLALVPGKNGPKFTREPAAPFPAAPIPNGFLRVAGDHISMHTLVLLLSRYERQTIIDMTGLDGDFGIALQWLRGADQPAGLDSSGPTVFTAVQEQLGLRLESRKGPLDVLVIDGAEQIPAEN